MCSTNDVGRNILGTVFWITGLSGAGKTTFGRRLLSNFRAQSVPCIFLDGDNLRKLLALDKAYSLEDRRKVAALYSHFCQFLSMQFINVICSTISGFHSIQKWNRENIPRYFEIYLSAGIPTIRKRMKNNIYDRYDSGLVENVYGMDIPYEAPESPDLIVQDTISLDTMREIVDKTFLQFMERVENEKRSIYRSQ